MTDRWADKPWFHEGLRRYRAGEKLCWSTDIGGDITWGFGKLDNHGYWQYPVTYDELSDHDKETVKLVVDKAR